MVRKGSILVHAGPILVPTGPILFQQTDSTLVPIALSNVFKPIQDPTGPYKATYRSFTSPILVPICTIFVPTGPMLDPLGLILVICGHHISPSRLHKGPFSPCISLFRPQIGHLQGLFFPLQALHWPNGLILMIYRPLIGFHRPLVIYRPYRIYMVPTNLLVCWGTTNLTLVPFVPLFTHIGHLQAPN